MKQLFFVFALLLSALTFSGSVHAQCDGNRYFNTLFYGYDSSTVVYSNDGMTMDIYSPLYDTDSTRRVVLFIHGGNFYEGDKTDAFIYTMCKYYVSKGYVTASINYPLVNDTMILNYVLQDSASLYPIIAKTIGEGKAAVRYLKKNASALGIDSSWIVISGESSGALVADHVAYLNDLSGVSPLLDSSFNLIGGIEGNSGNPGYSSGVKAVLNYGGGLLDLNMLTSLDKTPIYTAQGDSDHNVPYLCGPLFDGYTDFSVCGGGAMQPVLNNLGIKNQLMYFDSLDYSPWLDSTYALTGLNHIVLYQVQNQSIVFLYQLECPTFTGISEISNVSVSLYPNPASSLINLHTDAEMESVEIIDYMGRLVKTLSATGSQTRIDVSGLSAGLYLARVNLKDNKGSGTRSFIVE